MRYFEVKIIKYSRKIVIINPVTPINEFLEKTMQKYKRNKLYKRG